MMQVKQFWQTYRHWILEICREVINSNSDLVCTDQKRIANLLLKSIEENGYCSNKEMAIIIRSNYSNIYFLIRKGHEKQIEILNQAIEEAKKY